MDERLNRYDFEGKNNRFMEFISREMMRNKHHQSHLNHPKNNSRTNISKNKATPVNTSGIYSKPQLNKQRRGASMLKSTSKSRYTNESSSKLKKQIKQAPLHFFETKHHQEPRTMGILNEDEVEIQQLHYEMVKMNQNVKRLQKQT